MADAAGIAGVVSKAGKVTSLGIVAVQTEIGANPQGALAVFVKRFNDIAAKTLRVVGLVFEELYVACGCVEVVHPAVVGAQSRSDLFGLPQR